MASITRKITEGTMLFFSRKIWMALLSGLAYLLIIRVLGVYQYGILTLTLSIIGFLTPFLDFDISSVICADAAYELGKKQLSNVKRLFYDYFKFEIIMGIIFTIVLLIFNGYIKYKYGSEIARYVFIISFLLFFQAIKNIYSTVFYSYSNIKYFTYVDIIEALIKFILTIVLFLLHQINLLSIVFVILISSGLPVIFIFPLFYKTIKPLKGIKQNPEPLLKQLFLKHGKFHIFTTPFKNSFESVKLWIIQFFLGVEAVAIFQVGNKLFGYLSMFFASFEGVLLPVLSQSLTENIELARQIVKKSTKYMTYLGLIGMFLAYLLLAPFLHLVFFNKYDASLPILYWSLLTFPTIGFSIIIRPLFFAFKGQKHLMRSFFFVNFITLPLGALFTYKFGVIGFAIPIGAFFTVILRYYDIRKLDRSFYIKVREFFSFDYYDKVFFNKVLRRLKINRN